MPKFGNLQAQIQDEHPATIPFVGNTLKPARKLLANMRHDPETLAQRLMVLHGQVR